MTLGKVIQHIFHLKLYARCFLWVMWILLNSELNSARSLWNRGQKSNVLPRFQSHILTSKISTVFWTCHSKHRSLITKSILFMCWTPKHRDHYELQGSRLKVNPLPFFLSAGHHILINHVIRMWTNEECLLLALRIFVPNCNLTQD